MIFFILFFYLFWNFAHNDTNFIPGTGKQHNKKDGGSPLAHAEKQSNAFNDAVDNHLIVPADVIVNAAIQKESPKNVPNKEKSNKKKRNDALLVQQLSELNMK